MKKKISNISYIYFFVCDDIFHGRSHPLAIRGHGPPYNLVKKYFFNTFWRTFCIELPFTLAYLFIYFCNQIFGVETKKMVGVKLVLLNVLYHPSNFLPSLKAALYINFKKLPPFNFRLATPMIYLLKELPYLILRSGKFGTLVTSFFLIKNMEKPNFNICRKYYFHNILEQILTVLSF